MSRVSATRVSVTFDDHTVLQQIDMSATGGELVAVIGPNGAGKTTLLRCLAGEIDAHDGDIRIDDSDPTDLSVGDRASKRAFLTQTDRRDVPYTVETVVGFGTFASEVVTDDRTDLIRRCMDEMEVSEFADRVVSTLSGGERRRVSLARTFAQSASVILLDEPTDSLDFSHADLALAAARSRSDEGATVFVTTHDLNLAAKHATRIAVLDGGRVVADGAPAEVLTSDLLSRTYGCAIHVADHPTEPRLVVFR
ncbi:MAG: ATP-binding cassette domain-containing protein [Acidimicrobiia bacterium]|nr:ATP-binding cassette domain-containing protein [Acidimicrobiia bacterium]